MKILLKDINFFEIGGNVGKRGKKGQEARSTKWKEIFQLVKEPFKYFA
jgi:hypothetical protein